MFQRYGFIGAVTAAAMAMSESMAASQFFTLNNVADFNRPKRRRTGKQYPHSSARQQARYARQLAAGQIKLIAHGPRA